MKTTDKNANATERTAPVRQYLKCFVCGKQLEDGNKGPLCLKCAGIMSAGLTKDLRESGSGLC